MSKRPKSSPEMESALPPVEERRDSERHVSSASLCSIVNDQCSPFSAGVQDISTSGIGLRLPQPCKVGAVLVLHLASDAATLPRPMPSRVMHVTPLDSGEWLVGCQFLRKLTETELRRLL